MRCRAASRPPPGPQRRVACLVVWGDCSERQGPRIANHDVHRKRASYEEVLQENVMDGTSRRRPCAPACPGGTPPLAVGLCRLRPGGPSTRSGPSGLRLLRMTWNGWSAVYRRRRRRHRVGGWDMASTRGTASPSSRGPRGGVPRRDAALLRSGRRKAADASMAFAEPTSRAAVGALGAIRDRAEEASTSWSCRRRRRSEARPEGRRRRDPYISERAGSPYPSGAWRRAYRAAGACRRGGATAGREGGAVHTLACAAAPTEWPKGREAAGVLRRHPPRAIDVGSPGKAQGRCTVAGLELEVR